MWPFSRARISLAIITECDIVTTGITTVTLAGSRRRPDNGYADNLMMRQVIYQTAKVGCARCCNTEGPRYTPRAPIPTILNLAEPVPFTSHTYSHFQIVVDFISMVALL